MVFGLTFIAVLLAQLGGYLLLKRARARKATYTSRLASLRNRTPTPRPTIARNVVGEN